MEQCRKNVNVVVTMDWWRPKNLGKPKKGEVELSGTIEIETKIGWYRLFWDKINLDLNSHINKQTIRINKNGDLLFKPYKEPVEHDQMGGWIVAHLTESIIVDRGDRPRIDRLDYRDGRGALRALNMVKSKVSMSFTAELDHERIDSLTKFCEIHGTRVDNDAISV